MKKGAAGRQAVETVRVTIGDRDTVIVISSESFEIVFDAGSPVFVGESERLLEVIDFIRILRSEEYIMSFHFEPDSSEGGGRRGLRRLDVSLRGVTVSLHDGNYIVEGELTTWIGYTTAY